MATVRITSDIKYYVRNKINELYNVRLQKVMNSFCELDIRAHTRAFLSEKYSNLAEDLNGDPEGQWVNVAAQHIFELKNPGTSRTRNVSIPYSEPIPVPQRCNTYAFRIPVRESDALFAPLSAKLDELEYVQKERDTLAEKIAELLEACGTLKQVLEVWPTALDFMPADAITRHNTNELKEKRKRTARQKAVIDDSTKVALLSAKLLAQ